MWKKVVGLAATVATVLTLTGGVASAAHPKTTLNVVHGIPGVDVAVCVDGAKAIRNFNPGEVVSGIVLPAGRYDLAVTLKGTPCSAAILSADDVGLWRGRNFTVVAKLDAQGNPALQRFNNNVSKTKDDHARVTIRHTAAAPAVTVWAEGSRVVSGTWFVNGKQKTLDLREGTYSTAVSLPGPFQPVIGPVDLSVDEGIAHQVYAWGSGDAGYSLAVVAVPVGTH
jgi:Domain of unknown function (DUF4397)